MCTCSPGKDRKIAGTDDQSVPAMYSGNVGVGEGWNALKFGEPYIESLFWFHVCMGKSTVVIKSGEYFKK